MAVTKTRRERIAGHKASAVWTRVSKNIVELSPEDIRHRQRDRMLDLANRDPAGPYSPYDRDLIIRIKGWLFAHRARFGHFPDSLPLHDADLGIAPAVFHIEGHAIPIIGIGGQLA